MLPGVHCFHFRVILKRLSCETAQVSHKGGADPRSLHAVDEVVIFFPIIERDNNGTLTISGLRKASHVAFMSSCMHEI